MPTDALAFLNDWVQENVNVDSYDEDGEIGRRLARDCAAEAKAEGLSQADLEEAAGDSLAQYMTRQNDARVNEHIGDMD